MWSGSIHGTSFCGLYYFYYYLYCFIIGELWFCGHVLI
jgi:hypothetical protein